MDKILSIAKDYLYIPVCISREAQMVEIFMAEGAEAGDKLYEFMVPVDTAREDDYSCDFYAEIPVRQLLGRKIRVAAEGRGFLKGIINCAKREAVGRRGPVVHFAAGAGWTNDPNGLICKDGVYHLYFQYNPFHVIWENMSWGHAVSTDLLHWKQVDSVMFPDEYGSAYSGCAIANDRGLLGLPREAILYFYTAGGSINAWSMGRDFTQRMAYSLDGGQTLIKAKGPCLPTVYKENRDPKVFWHGESGAYIMVLWLRGNDYGIFRSEDLENWAQTDTLTLEDAWECPDFFRLATEEGEEAWFFWTADGYYFTGAFDGFRFDTDGLKRRHAYVSEIPYAAQTFSGLEGRVVSIPWLRVANDGRPFTGYYGIPVEFSCIKEKNGFLLTQKPVRELMACRRRVEQPFTAVGEGAVLYRPAAGSPRAFMVETASDAGQEKLLEWVVNGSRVDYMAASGQLRVDGKVYQIGCDRSRFMFIVDDRILEIFFDDGIRMGTFALKSTELSFMAYPGAAGRCMVYEIE